MKKTLLLTAFTLAFFAAVAQDTVHVTVCTKFWKNGAPITGLVISGGNTIQPEVIFLDSAQNCADFEYIMSLFPPDATFSFSTGKEQDDPLNGVTVLDLFKMRGHILGTNLLPAFGMIAGDVNHSNSINTFDMVETNKLLLGIYQQWPAAPMWRFIPEYQLPFPNPANPFGSPLTHTSLTKSELQAFDGDTIDIIGIKTGDVNGDANPNGAFLGPGTDSFALVMPDIMLQAGIPVVIPVRLQVDLDIMALQLELWGSPGAIAFDTITAGQLGSPGLSAHLTGSTQPDKIRASYLSGSSQQTTSDLPLFYVHLTANANIALKDAVQIRQADYYSLVSDVNCDPYRLYLDVSDVVKTQDPVGSGLRILGASPNPFSDLAQVQIELEQAETVLLEVVDVTGKVLFREISDLPEGIHFLEIPGAVAPQGSMVLYKVTAGGTSRTGKLMR